MHVSKDSTGWMKKFWVGRPGTRCKNARQAHYTATASQISKRRLDNLAIFSSLGLAVCPVPCTVSLVLGFFSSAVSVKGTFAEVSSPDRDSRDVARTKHTHGLQKQGAGMWFSVTNNMYEMLF